MKRSAGYLYLSLSIIAVIISQTTVSADKGWTLENIPVPIVSPPEKCGLRRGSKSHLCDPDHILTPSQKDQFSISLSSLSINTPCFCKFRAHCSGNKDRFVFGLLLLNNISRSQVSRMGYSQFANNIRSSWNMGNCENNALIMIIKSPFPKIVISYGRRGLGRLSIRCRFRIMKQFHRSGFLYQRIKIVINSLKTSLAHPCACGDCSLQQSWYKMMAWLFAGIFLLSSLSFFSRRLWLRHGSTGYRYSPRFSLWDASRPPASDRSNRNSLRIPSVIPPRITLARSRVDETNDDLTAAALTIQSRRLNRQDVEEGDTGDFCSPPPYSTIRPRRNSEPPEDFPTLEPPPYSAVFKSDLDEVNPPSNGLSNHTQLIDENTPPPPYTDDSRTDNRNNQ